jgi:predicted RNA-binding Zn ribbon-like protein
MSGTPASQTLFDLSGGHPALDLVNSLDNRFRDDGPNENLVRYSDLLRFLGETGLLDARQIGLLTKSASGEAAEQALHAVKELREATAAVFYAAMEEKTPAASHVLTLERHFLDAGRHRQLRWDSEHAHMTWHWDSVVADPDFPVWLLAQSVSDLLLSDHAGRVRTCAVDTCRWLFLDTSKNHTRRWCNMKVCGNRMKARRFHARRDA